MTRKLFLTLTALATVWTCATAQKTRFEYAAGTRIGIVTHLESYATHRHFSSLRFDSFSKQLEVDWDMPAYINSRLSKALKSDSRYTVILIKPTEPLRGINQDPELSGRTLASNKIRPEKATYYNTLAGQYKLDVLIAVRSFAGPSVVKVDKHPIELEGYGLLTQQLLMSKHAYAYANITVEVFKTRPLKYMGSGKPENRKSSLKIIDLEGKLKNMPRSEIEKLEPRMKDYAAQAVKNALERANLLPPIQN
jgi:hypothetical protein